MFWVSSVGIVSGCFLVPRPSVNRFATCSTTDATSLAINKRLCPAFYDPIAGSPLDDCAESLNGVTFNLDNLEAGQPDLQAVTGETADGAAVFEIEAGTYVLTEQVPDGYEEPFNLGCDVVDEEIDELVAAIVGPQIWLGNFFRLDVEANQDIVCTWMNVIGNDNHIISATKLACPDGVSPPDDYLSAIALCHEEVEGVGFLLTTDSDTVEGVTAAGVGIVWTNVDLGESGEIQIQEDVPAGYGEPIVWCVSFPEAAADPEDFDQYQVEASDGLITASPEQHEPYRFSCVFLNIPNQGLGGPDSLQANPTRTPTVEIDDFQANPAGNSVTVIKRDCPLGVVEDALLSDYLTICSQEHDGVEFTLSHDGGAEAATTASGIATWTDVPLGPFEIQETLPAGYTDPIVYCGFTESPGGGVQHPALQTASGGLVTGSLETEGSGYVCYWMNIKSIPITPTANLEIDKSCPSIAFGAGVGSEISYEVTITNTGVVTLFDIDVIETREGTFDAPFPTELAPGESATRTFTSEITAEDVANGNVNNGVAATAFGDVDGSTTDLTVELNVDCGITPGFGGPGSFVSPDRGSVEATLVVKKWICPNDVPTGEWPEYYRERCDEAVDGFDFTLTTTDGSSTDLLASGIVSWDGLPFDQFTVQETMSPQFGDPIVFCGWTAYSGGAIIHQYLTLTPAPSGLIEADLIFPDTAYYCEWMNVESGPGDFTD